jgi:hypothetical protein
MEDYRIYATQDTPDVIFLTNGTFRIKGRSFCEDPRKFFEPLISWCQQLSISKLDIEVKLDYLNTSSSKMMVELVRTIDANTKIESKEVKWYFEEDDEDILEIGQILEETTLSTKFYFMEVEAV